MADYLPKDEPSLVLWLDNYQAKLSTYGATLGIQQAELTALSPACTNFSTAINNMEAAKAALKNAVEAKNAARVSNIALIRKANNKMKANNGYTDAIGEDMGIKSDSQDLVDREAFPGSRLRPFEIFPKWARWREHLYSGERTE